MSSASGVMISHDISPIEFFLLTLSADDDDFFVQFFKSWSPSSIVMFGRTSQRMHHLTVGVLSILWNIEAYLAPWFVAPPVFLEELRDTNAIIGGAVALNFFDRVADIHAVLDVYASMEGALRMGKFLEHDGYHFLGVHENNNFRRCIERLIWEPSVREEMRGTAGTVSTAYPFCFARIAPYGRPNTLPRFQTIRVMLVCGCPFRYMLQANSSE